jgi:small subunit ribosomal protein S4e
MSNSEYLKRLNAPRSWLIDRKVRKLITKPNPGAHALERALPLGFVLQHLGLAVTSREVKKILLAKNIMVDGKRVKDHRFPVGLFDVVEIPDTKQHFRVGIDMKGRLTLNVADKDLKHKPCRIVGKTMLPKGKLQINLIDSRNIHADKANYKVGDTLVLELPGQKVVKHLELKPGAKILITAGRYVGKTAHVSNLEGNTVKFTIDNIASDTLKENTYVIP